MSISTIRAEIKTQLEAVESLSVAKIWDYTRRVDNWRVVETAFKSVDKIHVWFITWLQATNTFDDEFGPGYTPSWQFQLIGFYSLKDSAETYKSFDDIAEDVFTHFANLRSILSVNRIVTMNCINDEDMLAGILCHRSTITLNIEERKGYV